jgi:hypothetical protein
MSRCNVLIRAVAAAALTAAVLAGPAAADQVTRERATGAVGGREMQTSRWAIALRDHLGTPWAQPRPRRAVAASASALAIAGIAGTRRPRSQTA